MDRKGWDGFALSEPALVLWGIKSMTARAVSSAGSSRLVLRAHTLLTARAVTAPVSPRAVTPPVSPLQAPVQDPDRM